ncbi:arylamine N-acetyltransferase family protein [Reichenbachiella versicolor]|uniref:arylamine N-acetyltransferase family protein n=1 Tax=Reichenbachiella versicolor TaxID=1821036 RepID=UPI0013A57B87|nr:arylamine N-acetyltransferase [Reichenbachiella versicolor]
MGSSLLTSEQVNQYLSRINCQQDKPSLRYLRHLHRQHMLTLPFENLDNFLGYQILLDIHKIFHKVMIRHRGGFCYELNGLFYQLLLALGYQANLISCRVHHSEGKVGPEFDHMAILVEIEGMQYLVDVGFGESFRAPLKLKTDLIQMDFKQYYKIVRDANEVFRLCYSHDSVNFHSQYNFTLTPRTLIEFIDMCQFHHQNKESHLVKKIYVHLCKKNGQLILTNNQLTIEVDGRTEKYAIHNRDEFVVKLQQHFGMDFKRNIEK